MPPALRPSQRQGTPAAPAVCLAPLPHGRAWRRQLASHAAARLPLAEPAVCGTWPPLLLTSPIARTGSWPPQLPRDSFNTSTPEPSLMHPTQVVTVERENRTPLLYHDPVGRDGRPATCGWRGAAVGQPNPPLAGMQWGSRTQGAGNVGRSLGECVHPSEAF